MVKKIAFYLPQFHTIPENDEWWGKGFTEWTNVKAARPQFKGHYQPESPLNDKYYNLLDSEIQVWQAELAKKYGIDAFCYYHYWFEGKLLLEKPMEKMLHNPMVEMPFCICWANETWARTWDGQETNILIKQNYNEGKEGWIKHFYYLLPFFKDSRYLMHDGKPMLVIYKPQLIINCKEMLECWNELAKKNGFPGLYIGYQHHSAFDYNLDNMKLDFGIEFEPMYTVREINQEKNSTIGLFLRYLTQPKWFYRKIIEKLFQTPQIYYYDEIWKRINNRIPEKEHIMPGAFCAWDNTPRKGKKATVFLGSTPEKFEKNMLERVKRAEKIYHAEYIFINAWNEWAEGAHLEPDKKNKYGYLEAIKNVTEYIENEG